MKIEEIIIAPVLTEKATTLAGGKVYMFRVNKHANKNQIKKALGNLYGVKIRDVSVVNRKGKIRRTGRKMAPKKLSDEKIAFVKVLDGKIDLFPQA